MADPACLRCKIPERLHWKNRERDQTFDAQELLYRRIPKGYERQDLIAGFSLEPGESVNRRKYSAYPADVLFNTKDGNHYSGRAVLVFEVGQVRKKFLYEERTNNKTIQVTYSFRVVHMPTRCMYPHCEIKALRDGKCVGKVPGLLRRKLRDEIVDSASKQVLINETVPAD